MKKILIIIFLGLVFSSSSYATKFSAKVGDVVQGEVSFGKKDKFPLPPGEFTVVGIKKWKKFRDVILLQLDEETGVVKWKIKLAATGNTYDKYDSWVLSPVCDNNSDVYLLKSKKGNERFACWMVGHSKSRLDEINRISISNNYFSEGQRVYHKIDSNQGILGLINEYENSNNIKSPDIFVFSKHHYSKKSKLYEAEYYYNPELDGIPKPKSTEIRSNEFHPQNINSNSKHKQFLTKFIGETAGLVKRFNELNNVKGDVTLNPDENYVQVSNATNEINEKDSADMIKQLKDLKGMLDAGVLTQEEFEEAKKNIIRN